MTQDYLQTPTVRVSAIITNEQAQILLVKHRKQNREYWVLPGGHLDFGETIAQCAERELKEETSLQTKFIKMLALSESLAPDSSRHIINIFVLLGEVRGQIKIDGCEEIVCGAEYKNIAELDQLTVYPQINQFIKTGYANNWQSETIQFLKTPWN